VRSLHAVVLKDNWGRFLPQNRNDLNTFTEDIGNTWGSFFLNTVYVWTVVCWLWWRNGHIYDRKSKCRHETNRNFDKLIKINFWKIRENDKWRFLEARRIRLAATVQLLPLISDALDVWRRTHCSCAGRHLIWSRLMPRRNSCRWWENMRTRIALRDSYRSPMKWCALQPHVGRANGKTVMSYVTLRRVQQETDMQVLNFSWLITIPSLILV